MALELLRQSIDARKKQEISYVYTVLAETEKEEKIYKKQNHKNISLAEKKEYIFPVPGSEKLNSSPVIVGSGPAGLFCGYLLAKMGYRPIILERGGKIEERRKDVSLFWETGVLNTESNVSFGEGGAGTFSDGKLNTLVKDNPKWHRQIVPGHPCNPKRY